MTLIEFRLPIMNHRNIVFHDQKVAELGIYGRIGKIQLFLHHTRSLDSQFPHRRLPDRVIFLSSEASVADFERSWRHYQMWRSTIVYDWIIWNSTVRAECYSIWSNDQHKQGKVGRMRSCSSRGLFYRYFQLNLHRRGVHRKCCFHLV